MRCTSPLALFGVLSFGLSSFLPAQSDTSAVPEANPARPTVSTPATLTPPGYLQFENGVLFAAKSPEFSRRLGIEQVTKLSINGRIQLLALFEPFTHSSGVGVRNNWPGDVFAGVQTVILPGKGERPTISAQYSRQLYASPAPNLDLGSSTQNAAILLSDDLFGFHFDINGLAMEQQDDTTRARRGQFAQTLSISHPVWKLTVAGEAWHFSQPLTHGDAVGNLWALSYPIRANLVIDAGFDHGFTNTSTRWEGFAGFTYLLPHRIWHQKNSLN